jgi:hypothetical protein
VFSIAFGRTLHVFAPLLRILLHHDNLPALDSLSGRHSFDDVAIDRARMCVHRKRFEGRRERARSFDSNVFREEICPYDVRLIPCQYAAPCLRC